MRLVVRRWTDLVAYASRDRTGDDLLRSRLILVVSCALSVACLPGLVFGLAAGQLFGPLVALTLTTSYVGVVWCLGRPHGLEPAARLLIVVLLTGCLLFMIPQPEGSLYSTVMLVGPTAAFLLGPLAGWRWYAIQAGACTVVTLVAFDDPVRRIALLEVIAGANITGLVLMSLITVVLNSLTARAIAVERTNRELVTAREQAAAAHAASLADREWSESLANTLAQEKIRLASVIDNLPHAVYWRDPDGSLAGWNRTFDLLANDPVHALMLHGGRSVAERDLGAMASETATTDEAEIWDVGPVSLPMAVSRVPLPTQDGPGVLVMAQDVSARRSLEQQLATARQLEAVGRLAAGIAHEINTPAQYVGDNLEFLQQSFEELAEPIGRFIASEDAAVAAATLWDALEEIDFGYIAEEVPKAFRESVDGMSHVKEIVLGMKRFSHRSSEPGVADLNEAIDSTIVVSRNEWKYCASVETTLDPDLGGVRCLEGEIKQVLLNLVVNAAHAIAMRDKSQEGPGLVVIESEGREQEIAIRVRDNGCGMSEDVQARIFEPFYTTKPVGYGTGQGLALVHAVVVQTHGGSISVQSEPGVGTVFEVVLPREMPPSATSTDGGGSRQATSIP
ncbi:MAG: ATP-binding protein [Myxococcota bacterium]